MKRIIGEKTIARAFIFFLPFRMLAILTPVFNVFGMQAEYFSFVFHILGLLLFIVSSRAKIPVRRDDSGKTFSIFWKTILVYAALSLIMASYVYFKYGTYNGNSPYIAVIKLILDFVQYLLIMFYTKVAFDCLGHETVLRTLVHSSRAVLVVGYLQIAVLVGVPGAGAVYNFLAAIFSFNTFKSSIALTLWEPAWAAMYIGAIVIPLLMARLIHDRRRKKSTLFEILLWLPVIIMTKSTTAYLLAFAAFGVAVIYIIFSRSSSRAAKVIAVIAIVGGILLFNSLDTVDSLFGFNFSYLLREKALDMGNQSTASRTIPLIGNWLIFLKFPIIGCGNGLQGYFYGSLIPADMYASLYLDETVYVMLKGSAASIPNGQIFFPAVLSGYGIVGVLLMIRFLYTGFKSVRTHESSYGIFGTIYLLALIPIIISGFKSEFVGIYYIWFILSIPYAARIEPHHRLSER